MQQLRLENSYILFTFYFMRRFLSKDDTQSIYLHISILAFSQLYNLLSFKPYKTTTKLFCFINSLWSIVSAIHTGAYNCWPTVQTRTCLLSFHVDRCNYWKLIQEPIRPEILVFSMVLNFFMAVFWSKILM